MPRQKRVGGYRPHGRIDPRRLHPNGYLIGGVHDRGLQLMARGRVAGEDYFGREVGAGRIVVERKGKKFRYLLKRTPPIAWGVPDELALLRSQHFLKDHKGEWFASEAEFKVAFATIFDNLVDAYKHG